ncbi:LacI family DNA-binding transcriptional regulator [Paenibacillus sp. R14(2021)]|uniref:LacI family DNA-binding transcriptional regulator n=1 Tax=Paenibacillus sp. R14(2021) TaxID=2859228 RepID=UPI001C614483|nr:LacI family DNA-binding transcriptional regulator [Paenibacillus sp. R14(2021)]
MASIKEIAERSGFSISTVSRTLNNYTDVNAKTREKIMQIAKEMNYYPNAVARSLVQKKTHTIGMFFGNKENSALDHPFFLDIVSAVREEMGNQGYDILLFTNKTKEHSTLTTLCRERSVDGVVLLLSGEGKKRTEQLDELQDSNIPCVAIDIPLVGDRCTYVESDNYTGAKEAVNYLISQGHRTIAFIGGDEISKQSFDRMRGYQDALMENKLGMDPMLMRLGYFSKTRAVEEAGYLLAHKPNITAFFCVSDQMANVVIEFLNSRGMNVPEDISVMGFDDIKEAVYFRPRLTTIRQNKYEMGTQAARILLQTIDDEATRPEPVTLPCELVIRESVAKPRHI